MIINFFRNVLAAVAMWTMIFSPVAFGLQSQSQFNRVTQDQIKTMLIDLGLNKKTTYAQFWDRTKHMYPAQVYSEVEAYFKVQPSAVMPAFEVTYTQATGGDKVPTIKVTDRGQTYNVEIIGELNEWARVNQVSLSESDLLRLKPAIEKLSPGSTKLETYRKDFSRFEGFPRMTPQSWRVMKPEERAAYIVKMRLLWFEARRVLEAGEPEARAIPNQKKPKKTSSYEDYLKLFLGEDAQAAEPGSPSSREIMIIERKDNKPVKFEKAKLEKDTKGSLFGSPCLPELNGGCVVAGHVTTDNGQYVLTFNSNSPKTLTCACDYDRVVTDRRGASVLAGGEDYKQKQDKLDAICKSNIKFSSKTSSIPNEGQGKWIACQPEVYSYNPDDGSPYCIHTMSQSFQRATAFSTNIRGTDIQSCDEQSRLNKTEYKPIGTPEENRARTEVEQAGSSFEGMVSGDYAETKKYLNGMLKAGEMGVDVDLILSEKGFHSEKLDNFLIETQKGFEREISSAIKRCMAGGARHMPNQGEACEQLHRRWLFTEKYLAQFRQKSCLPGTTYLGVYDKGEKILSSKMVQAGMKKISKTELNKKTLAEIRDIPVCQCPGSSKIVKFGQSCTERTPDVVAAICPIGTEPYSGESPELRTRETKEICACLPGKDKYFPVTDDKIRNEELYKTTCGAQVRPPVIPTPPPPGKTEVDCNARFPKASPVDPNNDCRCTGGTRTGDYPVKKWKNSSNSSGEGNYPPAAEEPDEYSCDNNKVNLWPLLPFALLPLLFLKKKKDTPPACPVNQVLKLGFCTCKFSLPGICPAGANSDCTGCALVPSCTWPLTGDHPNCICYNLKTCVGKNVLLQPAKCECQPVEGGTTPDTCTSTDCTGGTPALPPVGR